MERAQAFRCAKKLQLDGEHVPLKYLPLILQMLAHDWETRPCAKDVLSHFQEEPASLEGENEALRKENHVLTEELHLLRSELSVLKKEGLNTDVIETQLSNNQETNQEIDELKRQLKESRKESSKLRKKLRKKKK